MKKLFYPLSICGLLLVAACGTPKNTTTAIVNENNMEVNEIIGKKWKLIELNGKAVPDKVNGKMPFLQLTESDMRYAASGGCNGIGGNFSLSGKGRIKFSQGMSTMMACENMEVETQLSKALVTADNYTITAQTLSLNKAKMAPLARFEVIEDDKTEGSAQHELSGTWEVDYVSGARIAFEGLYPDKKPTITFNVAEGKINGNSSCNNFNATFSIEGNTIKFNEPAATRMACPGAGEATFFNTLKSVNRYSVNGKTLNMIMGDIAVMRLQKK